MKERKWYNWETEASYCWFDELLFNVPKEVCTQQLSNYLEHYGNVPQIGDVIDDLRKFIKAPHFNDDSMYYEVRHTEERNEDGFYEICVTYNLSGGPRYGSWEADHLVTVRIPSGDGCDSDMHIYVVRKVD